MCDESSAGVCLSKAGERRQSSEIQEPSGIYSNGLKPSLQTTLPMESSEPMPGIISGSSPPPAEAEVSDNDIVTPSKRSGLRHRSEVTNLVTFDPIAEAMKPLTDDERRNWTGWVELESDPVRFTILSWFLRPMELCTYSQTLICSRPCLTLSCANTA
jgi:ubiquitin carboxyl-terminal hydrolase L5